MNNIVVIDDEKIVLNAVTRVLKRSGYAVIPVNVGTDAWNIIVEADPLFIFLDIKMPGINGMDLLKSIKEQFPGKKVIMMSGYTSPEVLEEAQSLGADAFLRKPFDDIDDILKVIDDLSI